MTKVLITGAGGFIASHLVEHCIIAYGQIKAFVHYNSLNRWGWLENHPLEHDIEIITGDLRDFDSVSNAMQGVDIVYHLGALIGIPYSYLSPAAYIKTNIEGTYNILEAARQKDVAKVILTSTSEVYGSAQFVPMPETHPLNAQSPYAATKIAADQLGLSYYRSFGTPVKIVRPFNAYGPRQSARAVIPTIISQMLAQKPEIKLGNIHPTRDFTFVKDLARAFVSIEQADSLFGEVTNVGMNTEISIGSLVDLIAIKLDYSGIIVSEGQRSRAEASEVDRLYCDNSKILSHTGWKPEYDINSGLDETIQWFIQNRDLYKEGIYNV